MKHVCGMTISRWKGMRCQKETRPGHNAGAHSTKVIGSRLQDQERYSFNFVVRRPLRPYLSMERCQLRYSSTVKA